MSRTLEERLEDTGPGVSKAANWLLYGIVGLLVVLIIWAALTRLDVVVRGQGSVTPSSALQVVSNLEGGIIEEVFVQTGEAVTAGQPLIALDQTETGSNLSINRSQARALEAQIARLRAEATGRSPSFPSSDDPIMREQVEIERELYSSRQSNLRSALQAAQARVSQASRVVQQAQSQLAARESAESAAAEQLNAIRPLVEQRIEPRIALVEAENRLRVAQSETAAARAEITRANSSVAEARADLARQRQDWQSSAAEELAAAQSELVSKRQAQPALAERLQRTIVRSPVAGEVNRILKRTEGGTVAPGEPLVEVVPSEDSLVVEARIRPEDIGWVAIGQPARVNITAYDPTVYGGLEGTVQTISPDAQTDERTGDQYYEVQVVTNRNSIVTKSGDRLPIGAGMNAEVSLIGEKRSILDYILRPITRIRQRAFRE